MCTLVWYASLIRLWGFEGQWFLVAHLLLCSSLSAEHDAWQSVGAEQNWVRMIPWCLERASVEGQAGMLPLEKFTGYFMETINNSI